VVLNADGTPKTKPIKRMKDFSQLTPEQQMRIESISVNEAGIATPKLYSASWANSELRKFHSMGAKDPDDNGVQRLSDAELITQLANQAEELGIEIDFELSVGWGAITDQGAHRTARYAPFDPDHAAAQEREAEIDRNRRRPGRKMLYPC
jgi:hypothetical protein